MRIFKLYGLYKNSDPKRKKKKKVLVKANIDASLMVGVFCSINCSSFYIC